MAQTGVAEGWAGSDAGRFQREGHQDVLLDEMGVKDRAQPGASRGPQRSSVTGARGRPARGEPTGRVRRACLCWARNETDKGF